MSRYYNYFQCYIFRLLIVGVLGVIILYPIAIVVGSLLCIILTVTIWLWIPVILAVCYLFNILVYQFESSQVVRGLIRSIPLLSLIFVIIFGILSIFWGAIRMVLIAPLLSGLYIVFLAIQRVFRAFTDQIMLLIFKKLGRTPSRDTVITKKISGPGMSRSYFYSVNEEDVYVLIQSEL